MPRPSSRFLAVTDQTPLRRQPGRAVRTVGLHLVALGPLLLAACDGTSFVTVHERTTSFEEGWDGWAGRVWVEDMTVAPEPTFELRESVPAPGRCAWLEATPSGNVVLWLEREIPLENGSYTVELTWRVSPVGGIVSPFTPIAHSGAAAGDTDPPADNPQLGPVWLESAGVIGTASGTQASLTFAARHTVTVAAGPLRVAVGYANRSPARHGVCIDEIRVRVWAEKGAGGPMGAG